MPKDMQAEILANTRLAVAHASHTPPMMAAIIIAIIHSFAPFSFFNLILQWIWIMLAVWIYVKYKKIEKRITKEYKKNGS